MTKRFRGFITVLVLFWWVSFSASAQEWQVSPDQDLQMVLNRASSGDEVILSAGRYLGSFVIAQSMSLKGDAGAVIDAQGEGHALYITASEVTIDGIRIVNWGDDLTEQNAGIYADKKPENVIIQNTYLEGDGFGIWLQGGKDCQVINNQVVGNTALRSADRGNGIQLSNMKNSLVRGNEISKTRDGLYVIASKDNVLENNTMHDLRYGIHYMYSYSNKILNNYAYSTRAGYAMMNSRYLEIRGNVSENTEDYGFLLNYIIYSEIDSNIIKNVWTKPENKVPGRDGKALFVYNSGYNTISNNYVEHAEIGIHLTAGSEKVKVFGNSFIDNPIQVKYVSNRFQEWSQEGKGNYWSNYHGWDMDGDGHGDVPFEPNDGVDKLFWKYPEAKMLMDSPAVLLLRWVQGQFPVLKAPGVKDSFPLMKPNRPVAEKTLLGGL
ncbi:nitrous oxide reductase family maturation protein NosD [Litoribacillus peritrichatus]